MADHTITETALGDGRISYELGEPNWQSREIPNIRSPGGSVQLAEDRLIDIVVLGDGYTDPSTFGAALDQWLTDLYAIEVYDRFAGCLRIRALYTPSTEPASPSRGSYYCIPIDPKRGGVDQTAYGDWWQDPSPRNDAFREALWTSVDTFGDRNLRRYPDDLTIGDGLVIDQDEVLRGVYRNLVVSMLVRTTPADKPDVPVSGCNKPVPRPAPNEDKRVRVGFGDFAVHELSHMLGLLMDEYIYVRGQVADVHDPDVPSVFSLSNVRYSDRIDHIPWLHLSPWGLQPRAAGAQHPSPLVGWLWMGAGNHGYEDDKGMVAAWHSQYTCLMNGTHQNYWFTSDDDEDPRNTDPNDPTKAVGTNLRDNTTLCLWCQELVTIRLLERTDQLLEPGDPADITAQGQTWWTRWVENLRPNYLELFDVPRQIADAEARYATLEPGPAGQPLWQSDLYSIPTAAPSAAPPPAPELTDEEVLLLNVAAS